MLQDAALETLFLPFRDGALAPPDGPTLFLRARLTPGLALFKQQGLICRQSFRPLAVELERAGFEVATKAGGHFPLVLVLPPRQRDEARAMLAEAAIHAAPEGIVIAAMLNAEGARSAEDDLGLIAGPVESRSKRKCRVFWAKAAGGDMALRESWAAFDQPRRIVDAQFPGGEFWSRPGIFAWDRIDAGSALLAEHLPRDLAGRGADLGAGVGYLAAEILARCPKVTALDLYEAEARALDLARKNVVPPTGIAVDFFWHDVTEGLGTEGLKLPYDFIVTNPPFHQGRAERVDVGRAFLTATAASLVRGGRLWLVANEHLPYEAELKARFSVLRNVAETGGYKIIEAVKG